jgi:hypothetical protein
MNALTLETYQQAANSALAWITSQIDEEGSLGSDNRDLACYYKLPYLMQLAGRVVETHRLLDFVSANFQRPNGDFATSEQQKTADPVLSLYPGYINGWIAMAAHKAGRFEISLPAWEYLLGFHDPASGGFMLQRAGNGNGSPVEVLMTAHLGMAALYFGDVQRATGAGRMLRQFLDLQPDIGHRFLLRMAHGGQLQTDFPAEAAGLHVIDAEQPGQAWFFIGYPIAFLARLSLATGDLGFLSSASRYFDFARRCGERLVAEHFAHKVAWGAAELGRASGDPEHLALSARIAERLIAAQDASGSWLADQPPCTRFDQSAEVAIWLLEICARAARASIG